MHFQPPHVKRNRDKQVIREVAVSEQKPVEVLGHDYGKPVVKIKPTCITEGTEEVTCSRCGDVKKQSIDKIDHQYGEWTMVREATCSTDGEKQRTCSFCHMPDEPQVISSETVPHKWSKWESEDGQPIDCEEGGKVSRYCYECETRETEKILAGSHAWSDWSWTDNEPTCETGGERQHSCDICGKSDTETVEALGHDMPEEWTLDYAAVCDTAGREYKRCSRYEQCGHEEEQEIAAPGHDWERVEDSYVPAECDKQGSEELSCPTCGHRMVNIIPMTGHSYPTEWTTLEDAKCDQAGLEERQCLKCGKTVQQSIPAPGHSWPEDWIESRKPECNTPGEEEQYCSECGDRQTRAIDALTHRWGEWRVTTAANCKTKTNGTATRRCELCQTEEPQTINWADTHVWNTDKLVTVTPLDCVRRDGQYRNGVCVVCGTTNTSFMVKRVGYHVYSDETHECVRCRVPDLDAALAEMEAYVVEQGFELYDGKLSGYDQYLCLNIGYEFLMHDVKELVDSVMRTISRIDENPYYASCVIIDETDLQSDFPVCFHIYIYYLSR